jgi:hypothetical protein
MKRPMLRVARLVLAGAGFAVAAACTTQPNVVPSRDFARPTDIAFLCMATFDAPPGAGGASTVLSGQPMRACHPRGAPDVADGKHHTFAFIPNSSSGQLAVVDTDVWKLLDLDPGIASFNQAPLGVLPERIAASDDGCRLLTANHGSCDLTVVNPAALMAPTLGTQVADSASGLTDPPGSTVSQTIVPRTPAGNRLNLIAEEISFLPQDTSAAQLCTGASATALVTFPSCDLVALVDVPSGQIVDAAYARRAPGTTGAKGLSLERVVGEPVCPVVDCGDASGAQPDAGASPSFAGTVLRPGPLAILPENGKTFIGLANAPAVLTLQIVDGRLVLPAAGQGVIPLAEGAIGTNRLRLSIDPYQDKVKESGKAGKFVGQKDDRQYLYAIARDDTVRVIDVAAGYEPGTECETNPDPLAYDVKARVTASASACLPVNPAIRRPPKSNGPGLRFPSVPVDVTFAEVGDDDAREASVGGTHAWVLTASGAVYLVNIDPQFRQYDKWVDDSGNIVPHNEGQDDFPPFVNTLRNRNALSYSLTLDTSSGPARVEILPPETNLGPLLEPVWTQGTQDNALSQGAAFQQTAVFFPDPTSTNAQTWSVVWQGSLMGTRFSGRFIAGKEAGNLEDKGADFCRSSVQQHDLLNLAGCTDNSQCGVSHVCLRGTVGTQAAGGWPINGLCVDSKLKASDCGSLLSTLRRYEVTTARPTLLELSPHKDELFRPDLSPCGATADPGATDGAVAAGDGGGAAAEVGGTDGGSTASANDCFDPIDPSAKFTCVDGRCLMPCDLADTKADGGVTRARGCRLGRVCQQFEKEAFCVDGPDLKNLPPENLQCLQELLAYQVQVGGGFLVAGSRSGVPSTGKQIPDPLDATKVVCARDPALDPSVAFRIDLHAPVCDPALLPPDVRTLDSRCNPDPAFHPTADCVMMATALKGLATTKTSANPCQFWGGPNETDAFGRAPEHVHALFRNRETQFMLTNLETPMSGVFQIRFDVHGGFSPQNVVMPSTVEISAPARIVLGPFDSQLQTAATFGAEIPYVFVVDQRRLGRGGGGGPTPGQVLRINPRFAVTTPSAGNQPWFEDFTTSGNLFPLQ